METNRNSCRILAALVLTAGFAAFAKDTGNAYVQPREGHFERMMFNNPGLETQGWDPKKSRNLIAVLCYF